MSIITHQKTKIAINQTTNAISVALPVIPGGATSNSSETPTTIKTKYESNIDTNALTDSLLAAINANKIKDITTDAINNYLVITYTDNTTANLDLNSAVTDVNVTGASLNAATNVLTLASDAGGADVIVDLSDFVNSSELASVLLNKVEKIAGKGLSTNDFSDGYLMSVDDNSLNKHSHSNAAILSAIQEAYTTAEKTNLANQSGTNTGDMTDAEVVAAVDAAIGDTAWQSGGSTIMLDSVFTLQNSIDNTKQLKFNNAGINAATLRTITAPNFDFDFNYYFDGLGNIIIGRTTNAAVSRIYYGTDKTTYIERFGNVLRTYIGSTPSHEYDTTHNKNVPSTYTIRFSNHPTAWWTAKDLTISRDSANVLRIGDGAGGLGQIKFKFEEMITAERTALPNTANTTVYDTDLNKLFVNDGTTWQPLW